MSKVKIVFAYATHQKGLSFGNGDKLPWSFIKEDMDWFKESTKDSIVVMGVNTWLSIPKKLPNRTNVVVAEASKGSVSCNKAGEFPDQIVGSIQDVIDLYMGQNICIIGGLGLIEQSLKIADEVHITVIEPMDKSGFETTHFVSDPIINYINANMTIIDGVSTSVENAYVRGIAKFIYVPV